MIADPWSLVPFFEVRHGNFTPTGNWQQFLAPNPARVAVVFQTVSADACFINPDSPTSGAGAIYLPADSTPVSFTFWSHGALPTRAWWTIDDGGFNPDLGFIEVEYRPRA